MENDPENDEEGKEEPDDGKAAFTYAFSPAVPELLKRAKASLWVSTYQAGKLAVFREKEGRISMLPRTFDKAMGFAFQGGHKLALGTRQQIWTMHNEPGIAAKLEPKGTHDACFMPRHSHVTGYIDVHEMAWCGEELWIVNTLYSCLCTLDENSSFVPRWQPPFISEIRKQERCHLNGLAVVDGKPKYVTAFAESDQPQGWREGDHKRTGGIVIDVESGEIVARGLSMPHSPRVHNGTLYVLDSGTGRLVTVDPRTGDIETVISLPGFTRGMDFAGPFAFIGLSQVREKKSFGGVAISEEMPERKCGVWIVDLRDGQTVGWIEFEKTVQEVFEVQLLRGFQNPALLGFEKDDLGKRCVIG